MEDNPILYKSNPTKLKEKEIKVNKINLYGTQVYSCFNVDTKLNNTSSEYDSSSEVTVEDFSNHSIHSSNKSINSGKQFYSLDKQSINADEQSINFGDQLSKQDNSSNKFNELSIITNNSEVEPNQCNKLSGEITSNDIIDNNSNDAIDNDLRDSTYELQLFNKTVRAPNKLQTSNNKGQDADNKLQVTCNKMTTLNTNALISNKSSTNAKTLKVIIIEDANMFQSSVKDMDIFNADFILIANVNEILVMVIEELK